MLLQQTPLSLEYLCFKQQLGQPSHLIAEHVFVFLKFVFSCFHFCSVHMQRCLIWKVATHVKWATDPRFDYQLGHMLEKVENPWCRAFTVELFILGIIEIFRSQVHFNPEIFGRSKRGL